MSFPLKLRRATEDDAAVLLEWRNDEHTRQASHDNRILAMDEHIAWLQKVLKSRNWQIFIAEERGSPVGTVRAVLESGVWELSWTVAPFARGRGVARQMVSLLASQIEAPVRAEVKKGNVASARVAQGVDMRLEREENGVLYFYRPALK